MMANTEDSINSPTNQSRPTGTKVSAYALWICIGVLVVAVSIALIGYRVRPHVAQPATIAPTAATVNASGFDPSQVSIKKGQAVTWTNTDNKPHSVVADSPTPLFKSPTLDANDTYSYVFSTPGRYPYHDGQNIQAGGIVEVKE